MLASAKVFLSGMLSTVWLWISGFASSTDSAQDVVGYGAHKTGRRLNNVHKTHLFCF